MTKPSDRVALLPCPFCGGEAELLRDEDTCAPTCSECDFVLEVGPFGIGWYGSEADAATAWNRRATPNIDAASPEGAQPYGWFLTGPSGDMFVPATHRHIIDATLQVDGCSAVTVYATRPQPQDAAREGAQPERGAFYVCPTCHGIGNVTRETFDAYTTPPQPQDAEVHQLAVLADIRKAIGDNGKLMQDELVAVIAKLAEAAERYRWLRRGQKWSVINGAGDSLRADELDAAIDAALAAGGGGSG